MVLYEYFKNNRYPKKAEKQRLAEKTNVTVQYVVNFFYNTRSRIRRKEKQEATACRKGHRGIYCEFKIETADQPNPEYTDFPIQQKELLKFRGDQNDLYISEPKIESFLLVDKNDENIKNSELSVYDDVYFKDSRNRSSNGN